MEITSKTMRYEALKFRQDNYEDDEKEVYEYIIKKAEQGEFELILWSNSKGKDLTLSAECIKKLKDSGFKVQLMEKRNWDNLHRWYKGGIRISWYK